MIFTAGDTIGDIQCAEFTILDDFDPQPERNFSITIGNSTIGGDSGDSGDGGGGGGGGGGGRGGGRSGGNGVRGGGGSISISIDIDIADRKLLQIITSHAILSANYRRSIASDLQLQKLMLF